MPPATGGGRASEAPSIFQKFPGLNNDRCYWPIEPLAPYGDVHNTFAFASQRLWEVHIDSKAVWSRDKKTHRSLKLGFYDVLKGRMKNNGVRITTCGDQILSPQRKGVNRRNKEEAMKGL